MIISLFILILLSPQFVTNKNFSDNFTSIFLIPLFVSCGCSLQVSSMKLSYPQLLKQLYNTNWFNPVKLGLENMQRLNSLLNDPLRSVPIVHVTGTNGKGSVSLKIARALTANGIRTGLYTSPHISSFKERIQIDGVSISDSEVEELLPNLFELCIKNNIPATFFELATALAFQKFHLGKCEAVVLEVGLGGRLDATNIVNPLLSIITTIQFDHMHILGDTIEKIASEKGGIIKPNVDALIGPGCPQQQMRDIAISRNAPFHTITSVLPPELRLHKENDPIFSDTDYLNTDLSLAALHIIKQQNNPLSSRIVLDKEEVRQALFSRPICRFELFDVHSEGSYSRVKIILDMAHNVDALKALVARTRSHFPSSKIRIVLGMSSDKDINGCLPQYLDIVEHDLTRIYCTAAHSPRALAFPELRQKFISLAGESNASSSSDFKDGEIRDVVKVAIRESLKDQGKNHEGAYEVIYADQNTSNVDHNPNSIIIICGTAFIMSEARAEIGIIEANDGEIVSDNNPHSQFKHAQEVFPEQKR